MNTTEAKLSIAKLNNNNYQLWKFKLEMILSRDELWDIVQDDIPSERNAMWLKRNRQAMVAISLSVEDGQLIHIRKCDTAKGMWEALRKLHERSNLNSKLYLLRKLYKLRLDKRQSMSAHINGMLEIVEQLRGIGEEMKDEHIAALILCSLPESYSGLITALEARPESELTLELVKGKLMDEYSRRKENYQEHEDSPPDSALWIESRQSKGRKSGLECYHCGKRGHMKRDCRIWKSQKPKESRTPFKAKAVTGQRRNDQQPREENPDDPYEEVAFYTSEGHSTDEWYIDSGATSHMTSRHDFFSRLETYRTPKKVLLADGSSIEVEGIGSGNLTSDTENANIKDIRLNDVLYVPKLEGSLVSVKRLAELGFEVRFSDNRCTINKGKKLLVTAKLNKHLYKLDYTHRTSLATTNDHDNCIHTWHRRLGHRDPTAVRRLEKEAMTKGLSISECPITRCCEDCIKGKMTIKPFPKQSRGQTMRPYELLHSDVCRPMRTATLSGKRYVATLIDDYSGYCEIFLLKSKDEVSQKIIDYLKRWNNHFERKPRALRTDGGGEYVNELLSTYLRKKGIQRQLSVPYSPQQNGVAERKNRYLTEMTRCMLLDAKLDHTFWGEAISTATYLQNRLPHRMHNKTPYELWHGKKPAIDHLRIFGCKAYTRTPREKLSKLDDRAESGVMMGYSEISKGYRIFQPKTGKIIVSRSVYFDESSQGYGKTQQDKHTSSNGKGEDHGTLPREELVIIPPEHNKNEPTDEKKQITSPMQLRRSERTTKGIPTMRYTCKTLVVPLMEPKNWTEVTKMNLTEKSKWLEAIKDEMMSFQTNNTWELVKPPQGKNIIGCKWTFKFKYDSNGEVTQYKARLVAKGYSQKPGEDFTDTYAPVVGYTTIRALLTIAVHRKMETRHLDVRSAFLYGELIEEIFMEQPEGQIAAGQEKLVCRLKRAIYGLKQSANLWNNKINGVFISQGYSRGTADRCLYTRKRGKMMTYILVYVDDLLICSDDHDHILHMKQRLAEEFQMKDLGQIKYYLGIHIQRLENGNYIIDQKGKIESLGQRFGLNKAKEASTPMETDYLRIKDSGPTMPTQERYREAVGVLLYLSMISRPDISTATGFLGRKVAAPSQTDWTAVKRVIRYLLCTAEIGLTLGGEQEPTLKGYVDADWAGDGNDRKSTSGYLFQLGNSLINWSSRKQTCVSMSSTEAEYVAAASACQELKWLLQLCSDFEHPQHAPTLLYEDNQGCIRLATSEVHHARSKHIDLKYHLIKHMCEENIIDLQYCPTQDMLADIFTKPLTRDRHCNLRTKLRMTAAHMLSGGVEKQQTCNT